MRRLGLLLGFTLTACGPDFRPSPEPTNMRTIRMAFIPTDPQTPSASMQGGRGALQLVAVRVENGAIVMDDVHIGRAQDALLSDVSDDGLLGHELFVSVPNDQSYSLFVQTPRQDPTALGMLVMTLEWGNGVGGVTNRVHPGPANVDLGQMLWVSRELWGTSYARLLVQHEFNPLALSDVDGDGINDLADGDDDNDGVTDDNDSDADGDGLLDAGQTLGALPDSNGIRDGDGVPDLLE
ncbi:MAG: hypothetical protein AB2A00_24500 [Myxococcota bacterium]